MKKYFVQILAIFLLCSSLSSCKKMLNEAPISTVYSENFWTTETSVNQATEAMYVQLRSALRDGSSHFIFGDLTTNLFSCSYNCDWTLDAVRPDYSKGPFFFSYVPYMEEPLQNWSRFYKIIAQSNLIQQNVPAMSPTLFIENRPNSYIAEALFMRAYTYFYMTRVWGDPVYVSKSYNDVDYGKIPPLARTPESKVLDSCLIDLRKAAAYLDYGGSSFRANKGTVYSLMAHIFAWRHQYDSCHQYCQKVINNGGYALEPMDTYGNIWLGQGSQENILELPMMTNDRTDISETNAQYFDFFSMFLKGSLVDDQRGNAWVMAKGGVMDYIFTDKANDQRFLNYFVHTNATNGDADGYLLLKYNNFKYKIPSSQTSPYLNNNLVLFRLADIILLDAEAQASTGNLAGAQAMLKQTEDRAGITSYNDPTDQYSMLDEVVAERGRELAGEGSWFYDLIRTDSAQSWLGAVGYQPERVKPENKGYYWPLDMATLFPQDNLLTQNPWWTAHK
ncbi:RagB/SusD family nutrient uptake outer membrane protein [Chitinophagaceae bacterium 26-R-25]|nr:RagB/SusD family nutrient uptake outer membrane protein [Chitinophagaceae bacterium 26-R-25]